MSNQQVSDKSKTKFVIIYRDQAGYEHNNIMYRSLFASTKILEAGDTMEEVMETASRYNLKDFEALERKGSYRVKPTISYEKV